MYVHVHVCIHLQMLKESVPVSTFRELISVSEAVSKVTSHVTDCQTPVCMYVQKMNIVNIMIFIAIFTS